MSVFFMADPHFFHKRIVEFCPNTRGGGDCYQMTEKIVNNCNEVATHSDVLYILGDVSWGTSSETASVLSRIKARKHLVLGNHDRNIIKDAKLMAMFESVNPYLEIKLDGHDVILFHYPIARWNKSHHGSLHLYGHEHAAFVNSGRSMDVGVDARPNGDLMPWTWEEVRDALLKKEFMKHH